MKPMPLPCQARPAQAMLTLAILSFALCDHAQAVPRGAFWIEVDNGGTTDGFTSVAGHRTFDLYAWLEPGDVVTGAQFGGSSSNTGLTTTQSVFQHPFGGDTRSTDLFETAFPVLQFDTYLGLGTLDGQADQIAVQGFDTSDPTAITGEWAPNAANGFTEAHPDANGNLFIARLSITSAGGLLNETGDVESLSGRMVLDGFGPNGAFGSAVNPDGFIRVPDAFIPTPGPIAILALAGAFASRRARDHT